MGRSTLDRSARAGVRRNRAVGTRQRVRAECDLRRWQMEALVRGRVTSGELPRPRLRGKRGRSEQRDGAPDLRASGNEDVRLSRAGRRLGLRGRLLACVAARDATTTDGTVVVSVRTAVNAVGG